MKGKYVVFSSFGEQVLLLSEGTDHDLAKGIDRPLISAGFFTVNGIGRVTCEGESTSLHLKSRGAADAKLIASSFGIR